MPLGQAPGAPAGAYPVSGFDNINLFNGNLNFRLPLVNIGGRGGSHTLLFKYEQKWVTQHYYDPGMQANVYYATDAWERGPDPGFSPGAIQGYHAGFFEPQRCNSGSLPTYPQTLAYLTFTAQDGTQYNLYSPHGRGSVGVCASTGLNRGRLFRSVDGSAVTFVSDADVVDRIYVDYPDEFAVSGYLYQPDGTRYRVVNGQVTQSRDRNGNLVTFGYDQNGRVGSVTDSLGRVVTIEYGVQEPQPYGVCTRITYAGWGGAPRVVRISTASLGASLRQGYSLQTYAALGGGNSAELYNPAVPSSVWLPDGRRYRLLYNSRAEMARVELPTGGAVEYDHEGGLAGGDPDGFFEGAYDGVGGFSVHIYRRVVERRVYPDGVTLRSRMTIGKPEAANGQDLGYVEVKQYAANAGGALALDSFARHYFHGSARPTIVQSPFSDPPSGAEVTGRERRTDSFDPNGALLRKVEHAWQSGSAQVEGAHVTETVTTLADTGQVAKQRFAYDAFHNQTDVWEYDFGQGAPRPYPSRRTHTGYVTTSGGVDYTSHNGPHLRSLPAVREVYAVDPQSGAETLAARSSFSYDGGALLDRPGITGHDPAFSTGYTARGNLTGSTVYEDPVNWGTPRTTSRAYDIAGNVVQTTDPRGNSTSAGFSDSYSDGINYRNTYAYPTSVTSAVPDPSGVNGSNTPLVTTNVYDFSTGLVVSETDANSRTTSYQHGDPLDRLTRVDLPDGGWKTYGYGANAAGVYIETRTGLDASRSVYSVQFFDGLGRPSRTFVWEGGADYLTSDTQYDGMGRALRVSSQYRSAGSAGAVNPQGFWTTTQYDALGRVVSVTTPDGAAVTTSYSGSSVTMTDAVGKKRRSVTDALGRLVRVDEPDAATGALDDGGGNPVQPTFYTYDALDNLRRVDQGGQLRFFMYDSLGRLVRAKNPEQDANAGLGVTDPVTGNSQWSMAYAYDPNGNLAARTDARGVTASFGYDALNRNTSISYTDGTMSVGRAYDKTANGRGRLSWDWTCRSSADCGSHNSYSYDAAGRVAVRNQHFWVGGNWSQAYTTSYSYNLGGAVTGITYPSGRSVSYAYDAAGRPGDNAGQAAFGGNLGDGVARSYSSQVRYHQFGGVEQERFGSDTPVYNKALYNSRGQLAEIRVSTYPITDPSQGTNWNRGAIINHYSNAAGAWGATGGGADNNGHLRRQEVYVPNDDQISGYFNVVQYYGYDALNRLASVEDKPFNGPPDFYQAYSYDRWGNRTVNAGGTWNAPAPPFTVNPATNRLAPPAGYTMNYDAAGNLTYDNYTGAGSRAYDAEGRMTSAQDYYGQTTVYGYDADGKRVRRGVAGGAEVWQVYGAGGELLAEYAANAAPAAPQKEYGYRGGELLVQATAPVSTGTGLTAQYFDNINFTNLKVTRTDATVNFDWGGGSPHGTVGVDTFSARWTGKVEPLYTQTYTFYTVSDDGVRLWVNGQLVIDKWIDQGPTEWSGQIALTAGQRYDIRMEFYENGGGATAKLLWSSPSQPKAVVPQSQLYPTTAANAQADLQWLVTDQLGTPRMVIDRTGSLAGVKRHDYFPFGDEAPGDANWRVPARGYVGDNVRQKFTGHERDYETGLDYAKARYYSPAQGRFTSPDPLLTSGRPGNPQTWNRYSYCGNNPLICSDPTGLDWYYNKDQDLYKWFDGSPTEKGWTQVVGNGFVYQSKDRGWVALDPYSANWRADFASREAAQGLVDTWWSASPNSRALAAELGGRWGPALKQSAEYMFMYMSFFTGPTGEMGGLTSLGLKGGGAGVASRAGARFIASESGAILDAASVEIPGPLNSAYGKLDYLLGRVPDSAKSIGKGGFFKGVMKFTDESLDAALRSHLTENFSTAVIDGTKIRVTGTMTGPGGRVANVTSVWQVKDGAVKFVTAMPK